MDGLETRARHRPILSGRIQRAIKGARHKLFFVRNRAHSVFHAQIFEPGPFDPARFVGIGERAARHMAPDSQVIELGSLRPQAGFDVAQALAIGELRERRAAQLIGAAELADSMLAAVALDNAPEALPRKMIHQLGEYQFASVHARHLCR